METVQQERGENKKMSKTDTLDALDDEMKHSPNILRTYSGPGLNLF